MLEEMEIDDHHQHPDHTHARWFDGHEPGQTRLLSKPLKQSVYEARRMGQAARQYSTPKWESRDSIRRPGKEWK